MSQVITILDGGFWRATELATGKQPMAGPHSDKDTTQQQLGQGQQAQSTSPQLSLFMRKRMQDEQRAAEDALQTLMPFGPASPTSSLGKLVFLGRSLFKMGRSHQEVGRLLAHKVRSIMAL